LARETRQSAMIFHDVRRQRCRRLPAPNADFVQLWKTPMSKCCHLSYSRKLQHTLSTQMKLI